MFLLAIFLIAQAMEVQASKFYKIDREWRDFVIDKYPDVKEYVAQKDEKIQSLERENMLLYIENDDLESKNKILEKKLRLAKERVEEMVYLLERAENEIRKLEKIHGEEIIAEKPCDCTTQKWTIKEAKPQVNPGKYPQFNDGAYSPDEIWTNNKSMRSSQPPSKDTLTQCSPDDLDYFLKHLTIREDGNFQSPFSRSWMSLCDNRNYYGLNVSLSNDDNQQKITFHSMPMKLKLKNPEMFWMYGEIFELLSIGSFFFGDEKEPQNSSRRKVVLRFVSLRTGAYILFRYDRRTTGGGNMLYARDVSKPVEIILWFVSQYGENIGKNLLSIQDVSVKYMEMEMFVHTVKKQLENLLKK